MTSISRGWQLAIGLFLVVFAAGQTVSGYQVFAEDQEAHGEPTVPDLLPVLSRSAETLALSDLRPHHRAAKRLAEVSSTMSERGGIWIGRWRQRG
jgi:hypothetical protein